MLSTGFYTSSVKAHALTALGVLVVIISAFSIVLRPEIAKVNALFVVQGALSISIGGASFYFFTDTKEQYPAGMC